MTSSAFAVPVRSLRPIRAFAVAVVILIVPASLASAGVSLMHLLYGEEWRGLYALLYVPAGIAFLCWLFRARANAYAISPGVFHTYAAPFMVLGWVIPILNLFVPKGIVDDILATSRPGGLWPGADLLRCRRSGLVWAWWLAWLLSAGAVGAASAMDTGGLVAAALIVAIVLSLAAGLLAIRVVLTITGLQEAARSVRVQHSEEDDARVSRLGLIALVVRDYDEAIAFYVGTLGFDLLEDRLQDDGKRWVTIRPRGARETALLLAQAATPAQEARIGDQTGGGVGMFLYTDDFVRDYERLLSAGVIFDEVPRSELYGTVATFKDLYGNRWDLLEPNISPLPA